MSEDATGPEAALARLGIELPPPAKPLFSYIPVKVAAGLAHVSGQVPMEDGKVLVEGHLGAEVSVEEGAEAAKRCALQALSVLRATVGSLDEVAGVVQLSVFVNSAPGFTQQPSVANGASDFLVEVFGHDAGSHARFAVGVPELPLNACVEVALVAELA
ncbi:MAG: RidA family protein [Actinomycetota bacterium]